MLKRAKQQLTTVFEKDSPTTIKTAITANLLHFSGCSDEREEKEGARNNFRN
jgi:hypothetical protein